MSPEVVAPLMFLCAMGLIFAGYQVAFSLGGTAIIFGLIGVLTDSFTEGRFNLIAYRTFGVMENQLLLAVPFFIFMGTC